MVSVGTDGSATEVLEILEYVNHDLDTVVTPVNIPNFELLLKESGYDKTKSEFLLDGFKNGFSIGYAGVLNLQRTSPNLKLQVGNETELWNKVMKEVKEQRYAGTFEHPPFEHFVQSLIGLVPKDNGTKTRLIFYLSHPRSGSSINSKTPRELCTVKYCEFDDAVKRCIKEGVGCFISRSDFSAAFRNLGIKKEHWPLLVMKARHLVTKIWYYFIDKCLPFSASISCSHFQAFSDAIVHIVAFYTSRKVTNYLDDFLFAALLKWLCDQQVCIFLEICKFINFPVNMDKMFWGDTCLTFLGLLINTVHQIVCIPVDKIQKVTDLLAEILAKSKITLHKLQKLCGFLNFLCHAIVPRRAFMRQLYAHTMTKNGKIKPHHHIKISGKMQADMSMWQQFLQHPTVYSRPFIDFRGVDAVQLDLYSDASRNFQLGFRGLCQNEWMFGQWDEFTRSVEPSIEYLELYAVTIAVILWIWKFANQRITLFCDNMSIVHMINNMSSSSKKLYGVDSTYNSGRLDT